MPYYTEEQIIKARSIDLLTYLQTYEPTELVHVSIKQLIGRLEDAMPRDAVSMLQAVFLSNGKRTDAEMLDMLDICAEHYEDAHNEFVDMFFQTDEIDWFAVEHWLDEYTEPTEGMKIVNGRLLDVKGDCNM